jgi:nucleotide-binding universal stress UspA family protein
MCGDFFQVAGKFPIPAAAIRGGSPALWQLTQCMPAETSRNTPINPHTGASMRRLAGRSKRAALACDVLDQLVPAIRQIDEGHKVAIRNILVATDFSEPSAVALAYGRDLARTYHAQLHVLHVVEDVTLHCMPEVGFISIDVRNDLEAIATRDIAALISDDDRRTLKVVPVIERGSSTAETINRYAKSNQIDLIVTGTHGRDAVQHFLMGSVAERVVRSAPCPVLTVRAHQREFIAPDALARIAPARA